MKTYQFTTPHGSELHEELFLDSLSKEFGGCISSVKVGRWTPPGALDTVENELILTVQVSTDEGDILKERVCAYLRNVGERSGYWGHIGEHEVINLV